MKAFSVVYGAQAVASRAAMFPVLRFRESFHTGPFDGRQVFLHAHSVVGPVPNVHAFDLFAGVLIACEAKRGVCVAFAAAVDPGALAEQVRAGPVPRPAARALAAFQLIAIRQIPAADRAVHAARRDQVFGDAVCCFHIGATGTATSP